VWQCIREFWEVAPLSTSWKTILEQVADHLSVEVPSIPTVTRKQAREKWRKANKKIVKKGVKTTAKKLAEIVSEFSDESTAETNDCDVVLSTETTDDLTVTVVSDSESGFAVLERLPEPPKQLLERLSDSRKLVRTMRAHTVTIFGSEVMIAQRLLKYLETIDACKSVEAVELATAQMAAISGSSQILAILTKSNLISNQNLVALHGLDPDDFKDKQARAEATSMKIEELKAKTKEKMDRMAQGYQQFRYRDVAAMDADEPVTGDEEVIVDTDNYDGFEEIGERDG
jgi:hypothetical protein